MCITCTIQICLFYSFSSRKYVPMYLSLIFALDNLFYYQVNIIYLKYLKINGAPYVYSLNILTLSIYSEWVILQTSFYIIHFFHFIIFMLHFVLLDCAVFYILNIYNVLKPLFRLFTVSHRVMQYVYLFRFLHQIFIIVTYFLRLIRLYSRLNIYNIMFLVPQPHLFEHRLIQWKWYR